ncbi:hypothetical protein ACFXPZ_14120 [Streptomyces sp. NPDC059101]|uniref:zinc finger domain-containing protein n=1 Tax=Streptomyces sp. NPDC059101 TaxID=3346728 RepID=UPI0036B70311
MGNADSDQPLVLPLEPIELDAFRQQHHRDSFWCGHLLGGCGGQLTTKLYTDRVCHFAHHPDPTGQPRTCERRARDVSSADHLYVKSAAAAWLRDRDDQPDFDFARPDGAPIGSVVDIRFKRRGLRVHLDQVVPPVWDEGDREPVLEVAVPVDRDTLIRRWYVHRIRLESKGTSRRVRIGTEAFARPTEWFALDECEMTERGLSTPAVEQIVRSRTTRPASPWTVGRTRKVPDADARARVLLRKLADARWVESVVVVTRVCCDISALTGVGDETQAQLAAAVSDAERWLERQAGARRKLFSRLEDAVAEGNTRKAGQLLMRANATASHDRTEAESAIADSAAECLAAYARQRQAEAAAQRAEQESLRARQEARRVRALLAKLERQGVGQPRKTMRKLVKELMFAAAGAGVHVDAQQQQQIDLWKARVGLSKPPAQVTRQAPAPAPIEHVPRSKRKPPLHELVERRSWFKEPCPRCLAAKDRSCLNDDGVGNRSLRQFPHDERLRPIVSERKPQVEHRMQRQRAQPSSPAPSWQVVDVACPDCKAAPGSRCRTPNGHPHQSRATRFRHRFGPR